MVFARAARLNRELIHGVDTSMAEGCARQITTPQLTELVRRMDEAADAYIRGDVHHYLSLFDHGPDYTLMPPYGGPTAHGFEYTEEGAAETSRFFASGEATFESQKSYVSGDLAVLVGVERQHGEVGGLPDQDWSLRVTLVFRRRADRWELVHRHADPLVRQIPVEQCARLARGLDT
jgi:ketosteroid isomerase-like protein